jgi:pimeloyl-ACP methyl ester carboxylesterase
MPAAPAFIRTLVDRYDPAVFDTRRRPTRVRLAVDDAGAWDVVMTDDGATIAPPEARADALLAAGVDEFLRAYLTPAGRAAFYAAARQIYLEEPDGEKGFWTRLRTLQADALFVWGRRDQLVPIAFARHVTHALPRARHLELDCGHVPQVERPKQTHAALAESLSEASYDLTGAGPHPW